MYGWPFRGSLGDGPPYWRVARTGSTHKRHGDTAAADCGCVFARPSRQPLCLVAFDTGVPRAQFAKHLADEPPILASTGEPRVSCQSLSKNLIDRKMPRVSCQRQHGQGRSAYRPKLSGGSMNLLRTMFAAALF